MKLESYWLDTAPPFTRAAEGSVEGRADVVVVGGGYTGLSVALALARRGAAVVVLESGRVVGEASGRNGGHCSNGFANDFSAVAARLGAEAAAALYRAYTDAVDTVERIVREEAIDCGFARRGKLKLAAKPGHYAKLARLCEMLHPSIDPHVSLIGPERIRDEIGSDVFHGGLLQSTSAQLHAGRFGVGLAEAAARHGVRIYESARVTRLKQLAGSSYRVSCTRGTIEAKQLLVATGSTSDGPFGWFQRRLAPVGSFIIATEPLDARRVDALMPERRVYVTSRIIGNYFRGTPDHRMIFGGRARFAMSNPRSDRKSGDVLRAALEACFPQLRGVGIDYCWGGLVDITRDRLPRAGEHEGLFYSMGYSGHGVQMAVHMGQVMADVMEGRSDANPWRQLAWPAIPGHLGKPWFLPMVGAWYRLQDLLR